MGELTSACSISPMETPSRCEGGLLHRRKEQVLDSCQFHHPLMASNSLTHRRQRLLSMHNRTCNSTFGHGLFNIYAFEEASTWYFTRCKPGVAYSKPSCLHILCLVDPTALRRYHTQRIRRTRSLSGQHRDLHSFENLSAVLQYRSIAAGRLSRVGA